MAVEAGSVEVEIKARLDQFERDLSRVRRDLGRFDQQGSQAMRNVERNTRSMSQAFGVAARAAGALIAAFSAQQLIQAADSVALVTARIGLYTRTAAEAEQITAKLFDVARQTGVSFNSLAETYARLAPAQERLNLSSQQLLNISEAVGSAFRVSGASAQEAANATIQLSQAFASGELRGEELRSVMEQGQRIMIALQNQLGKTTGELRDMAEAGELTADVVANALLEELPKLRDEISELPDTAAVGFTRLSASFTQLIANINEATGATGILSNAMTSIAEVIDEINQRSFGDLQVQLRFAREEIERLETQGSSFERFLQGFAVTTATNARLRIFELANAFVVFRDEIAPATVAIFNANVAMQRNAERAEEARQQIDWQARAAEDLASSWVRAASEIDNASSTASSASQEVSDEVQTLVGRLERQRIQFEQGAVAAALYAAEIAKGAPLNEAEAEAVRENAAAVERLTAARREAQEAQRDETRRLEALGGLADEVSQRERLLEALQEGQHAYRDMEAVIEAENFARSNGIAIGSQQYRTVLDLVRAMRDLERETDDYTEAQERANDVMAKAKERSIELDRQLQESADQISDDIINAFSRGWEDGLDRVAEMIRRWALENLIFEPIVRPIIQGAMGVPGAGGFNLAGGLFGGGQGGSGLFGGLSSAFSTMNAIGGRFGEGLGGFLGNTAINLGAGANTAGFLANAGFRIGNASPYALVGSMLGGALGIGGSGNALLDGGLSLGGAVGGQALGGALSFLGSAGGPVGAIIGSVLGQAIGGLFADEDYPYARSDIAIRNGQAQIVGGETLDGGNLQEINRAAQGIADAINAALGAIGASGNFGGGTTFGTASGRSAALGSGFFAGADGGFSTGATFTNVKDAEEAAARAVAFALSQAIGGGAIDLPEIMGDQFAAAMRIFEQNAFDIDKSIADLNFAQNFENALEALSNAALDYSDTIEGAARQQVQAAVQPLRDFIATTERLGLGTERAEAAVQSYLEALINGTSQDQLNPAEQALMALNAQFAAIREVAEEFGLSLDQVDEGLARATEQLREGFLSAIQDQVYQLEGRGFITQGRGVVSQFQSDLAQAQSLGVDPTLLTRRALLDIQRLAQNLDADQLEDFANNLGELPPELQGASSALMLAAQDLREWQASVDSARAAVDAATQAQADAERQLDATRDAIEAQIRAEELRAEMLRANADLARSAFDALASSIQQAAQVEAANANQAAQDRIAALNEQIQVEQQRLAEIERIEQQIADVQVNIARQAAQERIAALDDEISAEQQRLAEIERIDQQIADVQVSIAKQAAQERIAALDDEIRSIQDAARQQRSIYQDRLQFLEREADLFLRAGEQISNFAASLSFSSISPVSILDQFSQAQSEFNALLSAARSGDADAASNLTGAAQTLLDLNAQINRSGVAGSGLFQSVQDQLASVGASLTGRGQGLSAEANAQIAAIDRLDASTNAQLDELVASREIAQQQLDAFTVSLDQQLAELVALRESLGSADQTQLDELVASREIAQQQLDAFTVSLDQQLAELVALRESLGSADQTQLDELVALRDAVTAGPSSDSEQIQRLAELLGVSTDGFDRVRGAILESVQAAIANGQTFDQYLSANQAVFDALSGQDFDFAQFASEAFQRAAESFAMSEGRQAQIEAAEAAYDAASDALSNASQALEAVLSSGPGIQTRFDDLLNNISAGGTQVEGALAGLSNAITGAAADFNTRVDEVLNNDIQPVVDEIRGLRNDAQAAADRSARIEAGILDAVERNFRSDQPVIVDGVRITA